MNYFIDINNIVFLLKDIDNIKLNMDKTSEFDFSRYVTILGKNERINIYYNIYINTIKGPSNNIKGYFHVDGNGEPVIDITVSISEEPDFEFIKRDLTNCVFHEVFHSLQSIKEICYETLTIAKENTILDDFDDYLGYFKCEYEAQAFYFGFLVQTIAFGGTIDGSIDFYFKNYKNILSKQDVQDIKDTWKREFAKIEKTYIWRKYGLHEKACQYIVHRNKA